MGVRENECQISQLRIVKTKEKFWKLHILDVIQFVKFDIHFLGLP